MSTASQRRKAKRERLQRPFAEKVREVAQQIAMTLPRRRPEPVNGMSYVERIETKSPFDQETYLAGPRQKVWLKTILGDDRTVLPRTFHIAYSPRGAADLRLSFDRSDPREMSMAHNTLVFSWRPFGVRAGDTDVRWYAPILLSPNPLPEDVEQIGAARKAAAYAKRFLDSFHHSMRPRFFLEDVLLEAIAAMEEFCGDDDPSETRDRRDAEVGRIL
jgi:hypothetical protein